jgi:hypothetical protein
MKNQDSYGGVCPFCSTSVPLEATICAGCGARKGTKSDGRTPMASLMLAGLWCNTLGLILFATGLFLFQGGWKDSSVLNGTEDFCVAVFNNVKQDVIMGVPMPRQSSEFDRDLQYGSCNSVMDVEKKKAQLLEEERNFRADAAKARSPSPYQSQIKGSVVSFNRLEVRTRTKKGGPTALGYFESAGRLILGLLAAFISWKVASFLWVSIIGRASDPMWVRPR